MKSEAGLMVGRGKILPIFVPKGGCTVLLTATRTVATACQ